MNEGVSFCRNCGAASVGRTSSQKVYELHSIFNLNSGYFAAHSGFARSALRERKGKEIYTIEVRSSAGALIGDTVN